MFGPCHLRFSPFEINVIEYHMICQNGIGKLKIHVCLLLLARDIDDDLKPLKGIVHYYYNFRGLESVVVSDKPYSTPFFSDITRKSHAAS